MLPLWSGPLAAAVDAALAGVAPGRVAVVDDLGLVRRLILRERDAVLVSVRPGPLRRAGDRGASGRAEALPFSDGELAALVAPGLAAAADWAALLHEWRRAVRPGGVIVALDRGEPSEPARRALCGGLSAIGQRQVSRTVVTRGRIAVLDRATGSAGRSVAEAQPQAQHDRSRDRGERGRGGAAGDAAV